MESLTKESQGLYHKLYGLFGSFESHFHQWGNYLYSSMMEISRPAPFNSKWQTNKSYIFSVVSSNESDGKWILSNNNDHEPLVYTVIKTRQCIDMTKQLIEMREIYFHQRTFNIWTFYCDVFTLLKWNFISQDYGILPVYFRFYLIILFYLQFWSYHMKLHLLFQNILRLSSWMNKTF